MKLEQSFTVQAPPDVVWEALIDVQRVAPCLPGAEVNEADEDGTYHGSFNVKIGPATASYRGTLKMEALDADARRATMSARGTDKRGQGGVSATIVSEVAPDGDGTRVEVDTDFTITGRLARFGRGGMIEDVSRRLLGEFAACLQASLGGSEAQAAPAAAPVPPAPEAPAAPAAPAPAAVAPAPEAPAPPPPAPAAAPHSHQHEHHHRPHMPAKPLNGLKLFFQVLGDALRRLWRRIVHRG